MSAPGGLRQCHWLDAPEGREACSSWDNEGCECPSSEPRLLRVKNKMSAVCGWVSEHRDGTVSIVLSVSLNLHVTRDSGSPRLSLQTLVLLLPQSWQLLARGRVEGSFFQGCRGGIWTKRLSPPRHTPNGASGGLQDEDGVYTDAHDCDEKPIDVNFGSILNR